jgi:glyoxylase-like metal-dependent hydrolase (beta-lactamase superfamily II)
MSPKASATVRMYRLHELGDCFLVTFRSGRKKSHLLVDCGSFRNGAASQARLREIAAQIAADTGGRPIDVVVGTHQHNDHVSGFVHCLPEFEAMGVEQVWLSWLDDRRSKRARDIGEEFGNLRRRLARARDALRGAPRARPLGARAARSLDALDDLLGFFGAAAAGAPPEVPAEGVANLKKLGRRKPAYLRPGQTLDMPGLPAASVRVHVLGPPRETAQLYRKDPRKGESYDHTLAALSAAGRLTARLLGAAAGGGAATSREEEHYPFAARYKRPDPALGSGALRAMLDRYDDADADWRRIDDDWIQQAETLALFLDTFTNNSSLALAIELVESGKVLLFAADAQTGNWASWADVKWELDGLETDRLLARTVFYKVGHHASHNATLVDVFERMGEDDLVAFIPVHKQDPNITKKNGWKMPATNLFDRLVARTDHRVLQMDADDPPRCDPRREPAKGAWRRLGVTPRVTPMAIEVDIEG